MKMLKLLENLRRFDAYPKTLELRIQTYGGAVITVISIFIMVTLFWVEFLNFLEPSITEDLMVDVSRNPHVEIKLDIVMPSISCDFIALDAMDASGEQHLQVDHSIYKRRLDLQGKPIEEPKKEDITVKVSKNETNVKIAKNGSECGSCYGASDKCCNTCDDVREAYRQKGWAFPEKAENITQCKDEKLSERLKDAFSQGCQIYGTITVNRVSGSFHIAPGKSFSLNHVHIHDVQPFSSTSFNTTHIIKHLTFDSSIDSVFHNPLKNTVGLAEEAATMFQYYLKIIPVTDVGVDQNILFSTHFSVTKHQKVVAVMNGESGMPGIFFQYEFSPMMVLRRATTKSLGHFLTNICAIIGGVYTVTGIVDSLLYHSITLFQKKLE